jgi:hypothetical protein
MLLHSSWLKFQYENTYSGFGAKGFTYCTECRTTSLQIFNLVQFSAKKGLGESYRKCCICKIFCIQYKDAQLHSILKIITKTDVEGGISCRPHLQLGPQTGRTRSAGSVTPTSSSSPPRGSECIFLLLPCQESRIFGPITKKWKISQVQPVWYILLKF